MLDGIVVGLPICHVWTVDGSLQIYNGKIEKLKVGKSTKKYVVACWLTDETYDSAVNYELSIYDLACGFVLGDLVF